MGWHKGSLIGKAKVEQVINFTISYQQDDV